MQQTWWIPTPVWRSRIAKKKLYVFFEPGQFTHIAPLFIDVFPYRRGDRFVSKNVHAARVRLHLIDTVSTEQIKCIENGRYSGAIKSYMVVPLNYKMEEGKRGRSYHQSR